MRDFVKFMPLLLLIGCGNVFTKPQGKIWFEPDNSQQASQKWKNRYNNHYKDDKGRYVDSRYTNSTYDRNNQNNSNKQIHVMQSSRSVNRNGYDFDNDKEYDVNYENNNNSNVLLQNLTTNDAYYNNTTNVNNMTDKELTRRVNGSFKRSQPSVLDVREGMTVNDEQQSNMVVQKSNIVVQKKSAPQNIIDIDSKKYRIQCGNFSNKVSAQSVANAISSNDIKNVIVVEEGGRYKVVVGSFSEREEGLETFDKIKSLGFDGIFWVFR